MSKTVSSAIPFILILLLSAFFYMSPKFLAQESGKPDQTIKEVYIKKYQDIGSLIAHASFVEDAIIMNSYTKLGEIIANLRRDESALKFIHFTDASNKIIASSDSNAVNKVYNPEIITAGTNVVQEQNGIYQGGFSINIGNKKIGMLYLEARPDIPTTAATQVSSPLVAAAGVVVAIIVFIIVFAAGGSIEKKVIADISKRETRSYISKIESLKNEQDEAQKKLEEIANRIKELNTNYESKKKEMESSPAFLSVEKLKSAETDLLKRLETLKDQHGRLDKEIELLTQKREEIRSALEAEKKEESILHEKLALIKKKILRLETPEK